MQHDFFADIPREKTLAASLALQEFLETSAKDTLTEIRTKAKLDDDLEGKIKAACSQWKSAYAG